MAHHKSALKRIKTSLKANQRNRHYRAQMKTLVKRVQDTEDVTLRQTHLHSCCILLDRLATKGIIHRNTAARRKSQLTLFVNKATAPASV